MPPAFFCPVVVVLALAGVMALRARGADTRSGRLGAASAGCGLGAFAPALLAPTFSSPDDQPLLAGCGVAATLLGAVAVWLGVRSFRARRTDAGGSRRDPIIGLMTGAANLFCGTAAAVVGSGVLAPPAGAPREWRSDAHGIAVTVPTERWVIQDSEKAVAVFRGSRPVLGAVVAEVVPAATDAEYAAALDRFQKVKRESQLTGVAERTGPNHHGLPHWVITGDGRGRDGDYFFGASVTRVNGKAVLLMVEAPYRMASEAARAQEAAAIRGQAETFLGSVR